MQALSGQLPHTQSGESVPALGPYSFSLEKAPRRSTARKSTCRSSVNRSVTKCGYKIVDCRSFISNGGNRMRHFGVLIGNPEIASWPVKDSLSSTRYVSPLRLRPHKAYTMHILRYAMTKWNLVGRILSVSLYILCKRVWRNWQTRRSQKSVPTKECRFDTDYPHHFFSF